MSAELLRRAARLLREQADAGLNPAASEALADWLDIAAHDMTRPNFDLGYLRIYDQSYAVARAYLGEETA